MTVSRRPVTVARFDADTVTISKGLKTGDLVVTAGVNSLAEGQKVRLPQDRGKVMGFNLSEWALRHRSLVVFFMIIFAAAGAMLL